MKEEKQREINEVQGGGKNILGREYSLCRCPVVELSHLENKGKPTRLERNTGIESKRFLVVGFFFFFFCTSQLVGSQFSDQGLNFGFSSESAKY